MKVLVDLKTLLKELEEVNPDVDLTKVKAYLLDLALGDPLREVTSVLVKNYPYKDDPKDPPEKREEREPEKVEIREPVDDAETLRREYAARKEESLPAGVIGEPYKARPKKVVTTVKDARHAERIARRDKMKGFGDMTGKEIIENLTSKSILKRDENHQFVGEGSGDDSGSSGELEIG